jgi:hypothetical protein
VGFKGSVKEREKVSVDEERTEGWTNNEGPGIYLILQVMD